MQKGKFVIPLTSTDQVLVLLLPTRVVYRLQSPRGIDVVSLTLGNSALPFGDRLIADTHLIGECSLRETAFPAQFTNQLSNFHTVHVSPSFVFSDMIVPENRKGSKKRSVESAMQIGKSKRPNA